MSATYHIDVIPGLTGMVPRFSFFEQSVIEIPAPQKYEWAQKERQWILRNQGPEWFLANEFWAHRFYVMKRSWWLGVC